VISFCEKLSVRRGEYRKVTPPCQGVNAEARLKEGINETGSEKPDHISMLRVTESGVMEGGKKHHEGT